MKPKTYYAFKLVTIQVSLSSMFFSWSIEDVINVIGFYTKLYSCIIQISAFYPVSLLWDVSMITYPVPILYIFLFSLINKSWEMYTVLNALGINMHVEMQSDTKNKSKRKREKKWWNLFIAGIISLEVL